MWTYYCTGQYYEVSNRFMSMPSARNRIYGVQLYKYDIVGILHWGYNFYNSQFSIEHINPYEVTDAATRFRREIHSWCTRGRMGIRRSPSE